MPCLPLIAIAADGVGDEVLVLVDVLEPEHEVVGGERLAVAPLHAAAQVDEQRRARRPASRGPWRCSARPCRPCSPRTSGGPVPSSTGSRSRSPPGPVKPRRQVPPYLPISCTGLMTSGSWPMRSATGGSLPGLDQLGELRRFLERFGHLRGVGDDLGPFQLADERGFHAALRERAGGNDARDHHHDQSDHDAGSKRAIRMRVPALAHDVSPCRPLAGGPIIVRFPRQVQASVREAAGARKMRWPEIETLAGGPHAGVHTS